MNIEGKKILVVGMGRSGIASTKALTDLGAKVWVQDANLREKMDNTLLEFLDKRGVKCYFGEEPELVGMDMILVSPGVPLKVPFIREAQLKSIEILGELEMAYRLSRGNYVAITGTNGKTTTTSWVGEIFKASKKNTKVVGNIGKPAISEANASKEDTWFVTEVSSFQLETVSKFKPKISAILNITPDHLDRHETMDKYSRTKANIFEVQDQEDFVVVNFDDKVALEVTTHAKATVVPFSRTESLMFGAFIKNEKIVIRNKDGKVFELCDVEELKIPGNHNIENALATAAICYFAGIDEEIISEGLRSFVGVSHRMEYCGQVDGITYINDSKGTNVDAAIKAIEAVETPIVLIAGGYDKETDFHKFVARFDKKLRHVVLMGSTAGKIKDAAEQIGYRQTTILQDMESCLLEATRVAEEGDTILLSPACASWDMYKSFEERGEDFKICLEKLRNR